MNTAAHWMVAEKIWPSMSTILGDTWLNDDQTEINWDHFHTSGSSLAVEHRAEIERLKSLWETSKSSLTHQQLEKVDSSAVAGKAALRPALVKEISQSFRLEGGIESGKLHPTSETEVSSLA